MSGQTIAGALIGLGIGYFLTIPLYVFLAFRHSMWTRRAYRLAGQSNIALPANLAGRVARFLRAQYLFSIPALTVVIVVFDVVLYGDNTQQRNYRMVSVDPRRNAGFLHRLPLHRDPLAALEGVGRSPGHASAQYACAGGVHFG